MDALVSATLFEASCWGIAIFCSATALTLAALRPHPGATSHVARKRKRRQLENSVSLYRPAQSVRNAG